MTRAQGLLVVLAVVLLAAWLAGGGRQAPFRGGSRTPSPAPQPAAEATSAIRRQAGKLDAFRASAPSISVPRRNPFEFSEAAVPAPAARPGGPALSTATPQRPPRPRVTLLGIAEDSRDGLVVRTAVVSFEDEMHLVREGERVLGLYLVVRITDSELELRDLVDGGTITVALR